MLKLGEFSAWIAIEGGQQEVYEPQTSPDGRGASGWVASEAGKRFSVNWRNDARNVAIQAVLTIDGILCNQHIMLDAVNFPEKPSVLGIWYSRTSDYTRRDFVFAPIQVTDDDAYLFTLGNTLHFGVIELELWRLHVVSVVSQPLPHQPGNPVLETQILHERSKKAGAHHVKFGEEYVAPRPTVDVVDGYKMDIAPYATFTFRYRPFDMLMANGIIPRPMGQAGVKQEHDTATAEEIKNLEARLVALRSGNAVPKLAGPSRTRRAQSMSSSSIPAHHEVIDLT